jgi:hypothetical protein
MNPKRAGGAIIIFLCLIALIWLCLTFIAPGNALAPHSHDEAAAADERLTLYHTQATDVHTYRGEIAAVSIEYGAAAAVASIEIKTTPATSGVCAQVVTKQPIEISVMTRDVPTIAVTINGEVQPVTVIEQ